ncbi:MAG TPA: hypothetical protein VJ842_06220 [Pyrinomonadaceae bacterium]|nr:hypothetical protein [Pyrinomonadaceae bacterium]
MSIINNLETAQQAVADDIANNNPARLAERVRKAAVAAITGGMNSVVWQRYMALFCDNANELAQMTVVRDTDEDYMAQTRAYTPANAICLPDTNTQLTNGVRDRNIEPPVDAPVPTEVPNPDVVRDDDLFDDLRP